MTIHAWLASSLTRQHPNASQRGAPVPTLQVARGGSCSVQVAFVLDHGVPATVACAATADGGLPIRIRRVGLVPLPHFNADMPRALRDGDGHVPGLVPDPLYDETATLAAPG